MSNLHSRRVNGNLVFYDTYYHRWVDAIGPDVVKWELPKLAAETDGTTTLNGHTVTVVSTGAGDSIASAVTAGGGLVITCAATENDGYNIQAAGEAFKLEANKPCYFGIKFQLLDADQTDFLAGLCITDTDLLGAMTDGVYFRTVDESAALNALLEKNSTETSTTAATLVDATDVVCEFMWDGSNMDFFVNGAALARPVQTNLPNDEELTPSIHVLTGEATANSVTIAWARAIQIR